MLLDLNLGDGYGANLLPDLQSLEPAPRVAVMSGFMDDNARRLCANCSVALDKGVGTAALLREIRSMLDRRHQHRVAERFSRENKLSSREMQALRAGLDGKNREETAAVLLLAPGTISTYWKRIKKKTGCRSQREVFTAVFEMAARGSVV